jgi:hypothetical protein
MSEDRGRETGNALTEMRTVLSRAITARQVIAGVSEGPKGYWRETGETRSWGSHNGVPQTIRLTEWVETEPARPDPDQMAMLAALDDFIAASLRWQRTGRPTKS